MATVDGGVEIVGPPPRRIVYQLLQGGGHSNPYYRFRWSCPACGLLIDEATKPEAQLRADAHRCNYGWCVVRWIR